MRKTTPAERHLAASPIHPLEVAGAEHEEAETAARRWDADLTDVLLHASVKATIGSLWVAPDAATAAIMIRFYGALVEQGLAAGKALRAAQRWFRDSDTAEIAGYVKARLPTDKAVGDLMNHATGTAFHPSHPLFWAAFTYSGVLA